MLDIVEEHFEQLDFLWESGDARPRFIGSEMH